MYMSGNKNKYKKIVVLLSGGLDSSTLAYLVAREETKFTRKLIYTLTVDYGQKHRIELISARKISQAISSFSHKVIEFDLTMWGGSALTDGKKHVPVNRKYKMIKNEIPITYVPARNTIFLSFALSYAEAIGAGEIYIGVNSIDYSGYVDCRPTFIKKFQELADVATVVSVRDRHKIKIKTPLINLNKAEIVKLGTKLGVDFSKTWSCYIGKNIACGRCDSCKLRLKGFAEAGVKDPLRYKKHPAFYKKFLACQ